MAWRNRLSFSSNLRSSVFPKARKVTATVVNSKNEIAFLATL